MARTGALAIDAPLTAFGYLCGPTDPVAAMSLQGPVVLVAERSRADLAAALRERGACPLVEATWREAPAAVRKARPAGVVIEDPSPSPEAAGALRQALEAMRDPYLPVLESLSGRAPAIAGTLPLAPNAQPARLIARLASAQRVRTLHATVLRRAGALAADGGEVPPAPAGDPLDDATVLVAGRGRSYPDLTTAVGERLGLIGALSVETAARHLNARDLDGIVIGDGFGPRMVDAFLTALSEDSRFRDLPIALVAGVTVSVDCSALPNFEHIDGPPHDVVERMLPLVRQHALEARLQRALAAIEAKGMLDPHTGLFTIVAFLRDLARAVEDGRRVRLSLSLGRICFPTALDRRTSLDVARQTSRLVRSVDFACRASDGSILLAFPNTALRSAHVIARRLASALKQTMLAIHGTDGPTDPMVTLATLKPEDTVESLLARVSDPAVVAAG